MANGQDIGEIGLLVQEAFAADGGLRRLLEAVLNQGMREESALHVGAEKHERVAGRRGYRNGTKPRGFKTRAGELELEIPQVRNCEAYHPSMFGRWERSERALLVACSEMYFQGVSTRNVRAVLEKMCGTEVSAMTVSRVAGELDEKLSALRARRLDHTQWEYLMLDARYEKVRVEGKVVSQAALVIVGFTVTGGREVLDWRVGDSESEQHWGEAFASLKDRGLQGVKLIVSDAHRGIQAAMLRNSLEECLTVLCVPEHHRKRLTSTNLLENMMKRLKKRTKVVGVFPNRAACDRLIGAQLMELHESWLTEDKAYFNMEYTGA